MSAPQQTGVSELAEFIRRRQQDIMKDWEAEVRQLPAARRLSRPALINHIPAVLLAIADLAEEIAAGTATHLPEEVAQRYAFERLDTNFDLPQVVAEYAILRKCALGRWNQERPDGSGAGQAVLDRAIDQALIASVERYTRARDRTLEALDRVSTAAIEARSLDQLLVALLRVLIDTTESVDTAAVLLREDDELVLRASVGLDEEPPGTVRIRVGEGFAGRIAAEAAPSHLRTAATDPLVQHAAIHAAGVRALFGVPLVHQDHGVIGVVHMGSLTAPDFSEQDKRMLAALASRATSLILQHWLHAEAHTHARQQAAIADFGRRALAYREIQPLLDDAVGFVTQTLDTPLTKILELLPDGRAFIVRAGVGWKEGVVGVATVETGPTSQAGYTLLTDEPVVVTDLATETRFVGHPLLYEHGVVSGVTVIIRAPGHDARPYGVLCTHTRHRRLFTPDDVNFLRAVKNVVGAGVARIRAEEDARYQARRFNEVADHLREVIWIADPEIRRVEYVSPEFERVWGVPAEHVYGGPRAFLDFVVPEDRARVEAALATLPTGRYDNEYRIRRPDGTIRWLHVRGFPVRDDRGQVTRMVGLTEDITARKEAELQREELLTRERLAREEAQRAAQGREDVLAIVTHDLRNPLGAVLVGAANLVRATPADEQGRRLRNHAETIQRSAQRMTRLIDDLSDFGMIQAGRLSIERAPHDVCAIVHDLAETFLAQAAERGTAVRSECPPEPLIVACDRDRVIQALSNIAGNAVKVTLDGAVTLRAEANDGEVVFSVSDTGPGIASEDLPHIFERHWRAKSAPYKGSGLGLTIAKGIVDAHGGRIWAESTVGVGSTFFIALPR